MPEDKARHEFNHEAEAFLDEFEREQTGHLGCCRIRFNNRRRTLYGITEDACERAAERVGGTFTWEQGRC